MCVCVYKERSHVIAFTVTLNALFLINECNSRRILEPSRSTLDGLINSSLSSAINQPHDLGQVLEALVSSPVNWGGREFVLLCVLSYYVCLWHYSIVTQYADSWNCVCSTHGKISINYLKILFYSVLNWYSVACWTTSALGSKCSLDVKVSSWAQEIKDGELCSPFPFLLFLGP